MFVNETLPVAALLAFAALGANLLGTGLLLLLRPDSRPVRWYALFTCVVMVWLTMQGWFALAVEPRPNLWFYGFVVHMLPAFFLVAGLVEARNTGTPTLLGVLAVAAAASYWLNPITAGMWGVTYQAATWAAASVLHMRDRDLRRETPGRNMEGTALKMTLLVVAPLSVAGVVLLGGRFILYAMPPIIMTIQFLIFVGVIRHSFYDIEVRAARTGELAARAAEQERLALLGELSATLAHEIRNPLTGMRSLSQRLGHDALDDARRARYAGVILGEIDRLERIVDSLLDLARRRPAQSDPVEATTLAPLFEDLHLLMDSRLKRANLTLLHDGGDLRVAAPRDALAQALLNLLINAATHSPDGGTIRLEVQPGETVEIRVVDSGPGVPEAERQQVFEPFNTRGLGAGLGLAVVRRLAGEHGWQAGVTDAPGGGACFFLRVPAASAAALQTVEALP